MKLTDNQQIILNELAKNNGSIDDYKVVLTSVLGTSKAGLSRVVNNLKKEYMIEVIDEYTLTLTKVGASYVTVEVTEEDIQAAEITKIEKDLYFNINAARVRLPRGYQVEKFDNSYKIVNRDGKIVLNETEISQEDLRSISLNDKYTVALVQNAFSFIEEANEKYAELQELQPVEEVKEVETEEKSTEIVTPKEEQKYDATKLLITELQQKQLNYVKRITWEMVKRHIVSTLEQAQDVIGHLYKSKILKETERIYNSDSIKIFIEVVPITTIDEEFDC